MKACQKCDAEYDSYGNERFCQRCLNALDADFAIDWFASRLRQHVIQMSWPDRERHQRTRVDARPEPVEMAAVDDRILDEDSPACSIGTSANLIEDS